MLSIQFIGDANTRHFCGEILDITGDQYGPVYLSRCQYIGIHKFHFCAVPDVGCCHGDTRVKLNYLKSRDNLANALPVFQFFSSQHFCPNYPADSVLLVAKQLGPGLRLPVQPIDNNVGIKKGI